jgi:hypothetical protein
MELERENHQEPEIFLVDGLWGCGKSLVAPLVSSFAGVGPFRIDQNLEVLSSLLGLDKISEDAYRFAVMNRLEENYFNNAIGREINLRPGDDSSFLKTKGIIEIVKSLVTRDVDTALVRQLNSGTALLQLTHLLSLNYPLVYKNLPNKMKILNVQRDPLFLIDTWENYLRLFDRPREFTPSGRINGVKVPFFAMEWVEEWIDANPLQRAILSVSRVSTQERLMIDWAANNPSLQNRIKVVNFADLLKNPSKVVNELSVFLSRSKTKKTLSLLRTLNSGNQKGFRKINEFRPEFSPNYVRESMSRLKNKVGQELVQELEICVEDFHLRRSNWMQTF